MKGHTGYFTFNTKKKGCLDLGTWRRVVHAELDGPRSKRLNVTVPGE